MSGFEILVLAIVLTAIFMGVVMKNIKTLEVKSTTVGVTTHTWVGVCIRAIRSNAEDLTGVVYNFFRRCPMFQKIADFFNPKLCIGGHYVGARRMQEWINTTCYDRYSGRLRGWRASTVTELTTMANAAALVRDARRNSLVISLGLVAIVVAALLGHTDNGMAMIAVGSMKMFAKGSFIGEHGAKDWKKAMMADAFIGFGVAGSSTARYAEALAKVGMKVNVPTNGKVFVSINGAREGRIGIDAYRDLIIECAAKGAVFITDDKSNREREYNVGERELAELLMGLNYVETNGVWKRMPVVKPAEAPAIKKEDVMSRVKRWVLGDFKPYDQARLNMVRELLTGTGDLYVVVDTYKEVKIPLQDKRYTKGRVILTTKLSDKADETIRYNQTKKVYGRTIHFSTDCVCIPIGDDTYGFEAMIKGNGLVRNYGMNSGFFLDEGRGDVYLQQGGLAAFLLALGISNKSKLDTGSKEAVLKALDETPELFTYDQKKETNKALKYARGEAGGQIFESYEAMKSYYALPEDRRHSRQTFEQVNMGDQKFKLVIMEKEGLWASPFKDGAIMLREDSALAKMLVARSGCISSKKGGVLGIRISLNGWVIKGAVHLVAYPWMEKDTLYTSMDNLKVKTLFESVCVIRNTYSKWKGGNLSGQVLTCAEEWVTVHPDQEMAQKAKKSLVEVLKCTIDLGIKKTTDGLTDISKFDTPENLSETAVKRLIKRLAKDMKARGMDLNDLMNLNLTKEILRNSVIGRCNRYQYVNCAHDQSLSGSILPDDTGLIPNNEIWCDLKKGFEEGWYMMYRSPAASEGSLIMVYVRRPSEEFKKLVGTRLDGRIFFGTGLKEIVDTHNIKVEELWLQKNNAVINSEEFKTYIQHTKEIQIRLNGADYDNDTAIMTYIGMATEEQIANLKAMFWIGHKFVGKDFEAYLSKAEFHSDDAGLLEYYTEMASGKYGDPMVGPYALISSMSSIFLSKNPKVIAWLKERYDQYNMIMRMGDAAYFCLPEFANFEDFCNEANFVAKVMLQASVDKKAVDPKYTVYYGFFCNLLFGRWAVQTPGLTPMRMSLMLNGEEIDSRSCAHHAQVIRGTGPATKIRKLVKAFIGNTKEWVWGLPTYEWNLTSTFKVINRNGQPVITFNPNKDWEKYRKLMIHDVEANSKTLSWEHFPMDGSESQWRVAKPAAQMTIQEYFLCRADGDSYALLGKAETIASQMFLYCREKISADGGLMWKLGDLSDQDTDAARTLPISDKVYRLGRTDDGGLTSNDVALTGNIRDLYKILTDVCAVRIATPEEIEQITDKKEKAVVKNFNEQLKKHPEWAGLEPAIPFNKRIRKMRNDSDEDSWTIDAIKADWKLKWFAAFDAEIHRLNSAGFNGVAIMGQCMINIVEEAEIRKRTYTWGGHPVVQVTGPEYAYTSFPTTIVLPYISEFLAQSEGLDNEEKALELHIHRNDAAKLIVDGNVCKNIRVRVIRSEDTKQLSAHMVVAVEEGNEFNKVKLYRRKVETGAIDLIATFGAKSLSTRKDTIYSVSITEDDANLKESRNYKKITLMPIRYEDLSLQEEYRLKAEGVRKSARVEQERLDKIAKDITIQIANSLVDADSMVAINKFRMSEGLEAIEAFDIRNVDIITEE